MNEQLDQLYQRSDCHSIPAAEAEAFLRGSIINISIPSTCSMLMNEQSCDCWDVLISTERGLLLAKHGGAEGTDEEEPEGRMLFFSIGDVPSDLFDWKLLPSRDGSIRFKQMHCDEYGRADGIKFLFGSRILYLFALDGNLVVTKSLNALASEMFEDEADYPGFDVDDSVLFE